MKKFLVAFVLALVTMAAPAYADNTGVWAKVDVKVPVHKFKNDMNLRLRFIPEFAFTDHAGGLDQTVLRVGPNLKANSWFSLSVNGVSNSVGIRQDMRSEVQPEFAVKVSNFQFKDRNRFAVRMLDNAKDDRWQYANQLKVFYEFPKTNWNLFTAYEGALNPQAEKITQHRIEGGVGVWASADWLVETGYLYRTALATPAWAKDHFVYVAFSNK